MRLAVFLDCLAQNGFVMGSKNIFNGLSIGAQGRRHVHESKSLSLQTQGEES
jgi:hypothetical protein